MSDLFDELGASDRKLGRRERKARANEHVRRQRKKNRLRSFVVVSALIALLIAAAMVVVPKFFEDSTVVADYPGPGTGSVSVVIPEGASGTAIANILVEDGVIATAPPFIDAYTNDPRAQTSIDPGTYALKKKMSAAGALAALMNDETKAEIKVTIPEGFTKSQVYARMANAFGVDVSAVQEAADPAQIGLPAEAGGNPEGWFAPLTYTFPVDTSVKDALAQMVSARLGQLKEAGVDQGSWQTVLTKASILEREVNMSEYYPKVARVIENRLVDTTQVMGKLQMDSTVLYGLGKAGGSPTQAEVNDASNPYNTYQHAGLPPSPIGAAGIEAIKAVQAPEAGNWLYFVTVNLTTGETKFASTYDEHKAYVEELKAWVAANPSATNQP